MDTRKEIPKWEFGSAPISVKMQRRYNYAVQSMIDFLEGNAIIEEMELAQFSELKGMFNRCLRKDQWDWFSVFTRFGSPERESLRLLIPLLIDLRRSAILGQTQIVESIRQKLLQLDLLKLLQTFQDASSSQSNNTKSLRQEEAVRRIEQAAEKKLKELDLSGLGLEDLPLEMVKCTHLTRLNLSDNKITSIPNALGQMSNLTVLWINDNKITSIPDVIGQLSNLTGLYLSNNEITSIPDVLGQLSNLTELWINDNKIAFIPDALGQLSNLTELVISDNKITSIPDALGQLSNLTGLYLSNNEITSIPDALGQLSNLTLLDIGNEWSIVSDRTGYNQITSIPDVLGQLSNLTWLDLSNSQITSIPEAIGQLSNLKLINLSNNQITYIPEVIGQLSNLRFLYLAHNQITSIPETVRQLSSLTILDLGDNQITTIPEVIGQLSNLKELLLPNNQIAEIPDAIRSMKNLKKLDLRGNLVPIPPQVLGQGQDDEGCGDLRIILDYYFQTCNSALSELGAERQKIESEGYFDTETLQDARRRITASIVQRQGQAEFRRKLLTAYDGRCPITDCDVESAIEAAHIIPYQGTQTNHPTNGLPLRADIHTLFDLHLLSIRPGTNEVVIAPELVGTCYQNLADRKLTLPQDQKTAPNQNALSKHYETFLSKCKIGQL